MRYVLIVSLSALFMVGCLEAGGGSSASASAEGAGPGGTDDDGPGSQPGSSSPTIENLFMETLADGSGTESSSITLTVGDSFQVFAVLRGTDNQRVDLGANEVSYTVAPSLPEGVNLDLETGELSGIPVDLMDTQAFHITADFRGNTFEFELSLTVNDLAPTDLEYSSSYNVYVFGSSIVDLTASTSGGEVISYTIDPELPEGLTLDSSTGVISGTPTEAIDLTSFTITASNSGGTAATAIDITVNEIAPTNIAYAGGPFTFTRGISITALSPSGITGGTPTMFSVSPPLPAGLSLNAATGEISGTPGAETGATVYTVTASNGAGSTTDDISITVNLQAPANLSYTGAPYTLTVGSPLGAQTPGFLGDAPSNYSVSPSLPTGLNFNTTTGVISGTPGAITPIANYTVTATNSGGSDDVDISIAVNAPPPGSLNYAGGPYTFEQGSAISPVSPTSSGGAVVSYAISPVLPAGLNLNTSTGVLSGTPSALSSSQTYTVTATNTGGSTTFDFDLAVVVPAPASISYTGAPFTFDKDFAIADKSPNVTGGTATSYAISPALPAGLSFSTSTGVISGTPTASSGPTSYTVSAINSTGSADTSISISVNVQAPSSLTYGGDISLAVSVAMTETPTVSGSNVTTYSISPSLPSGLNLNTSTGVISGTPSGTSSGSYTVTATNSAGSTDTTFNIDVYSSLYLWLGGTDTNWSTGANWSGGSAPGINDEVTFDGSCGGTCNVTVDTSITIDNLIIDSAYTGTITQGTGSDITVGGGSSTDFGGIDMDGGTFVGSSSGSDSITVDHLSLNGGSFTSTSGTLSIGYTYISGLATSPLTLASGVTFTHNSGTVVIDMEISAFITITLDQALNTHNFQLDLTSSGGNSVYGGFVTDQGAVSILGTSGQINVAGNLSITDGRFYGGEIHLSGSSATFGCDSPGSRDVCSNSSSRIFTGTGFSTTTKLHFVGGSAQTYSFDDGAGGPYLVINNSSGVTTSSSGEFSPTGVQVVSGSFQAPSGTLSLGRGVENNRGTSFSNSNSPILEIETGATFDANGGTVAFMMSTADDDSNDGNNFIEPNSQDLTLNNVLIDTYYTDPGSSGADVGRVELNSGKLIMLGNLTIRDGKLKAAHVPLRPVELHGSLDLECPDFANNICSLGLLDTQITLLGTGTITADSSANTLVETQFLISDFADVTIASDLNLSGNRDMSIGPNAQVHLNASVDLLLGRNLIHNGTVTCGSGGYIQVTGIRSGTPQGGDNPACHGY